MSIPDRYQNLRERYWQSRFVRFVLTPISLIVGVVIVVVFLLARDYPGWLKVVFTIGLVYGIANGVWAMKHGKTLTRSLGERWLS